MYENRDRVDSLINADATEISSAESNQEEKNATNSRAAESIDEKYDDMNILTILQSMICKQDAEITFLRQELKTRNEHIATLTTSIQLILNDRVDNCEPIKTPVDEHKLDTWEFPKKPTRYVAKHTGSIPLQNRFTVNIDDEDSDSDTVDDRPSNNEENNTRRDGSNSGKTQQRRPPVVTMKEPERNVLKYKGKYEKPLILIAGDSTIKNVTGYDIRKECRDANIMVRPYRGGKVKNIRSLILDVLDDGVRPTAICVHAATNDIGSGRSIDEVVGETEALIKLIKEKEAMPIISLPTLRADKFS